MEIVSIRNPEFTKGFTAGKLYIDGQHLLYTLEDEVREIPGRPVHEWKIKKETAIPVGRYRVLLTWSPGFGRQLPELLNVPGFSFIRSHCGNRVSNTEGCILVGLADGNDKDAWLGNSMKAEKLLVNRIREAISRGEEIWWTVKNGGNHG